VNERNKTLEDFDEVLEWIKENGFQVAIIGGMAVGAFLPTAASPVMSGDLDLLTTPEEQQRVLRCAVRTPGVVVKKRPQPRTLGVLVLQWGGLEVDVLTRSSGLKSTEEAIQRAWPNIAPLPIADPVDLLGIKLAINREKDEPHIVILRDICRSLALTFFADKSGRDSFEFLERWRKQEEWNCLPPDLVSELCLVTAGDLAKVRYLLRLAPSKAAALVLVDAAPAGAHAGLKKILSRRFPR
jgi:hypothetical protein